MASNNKIQFSSMKLSLISVIFIVNIFNASCIRGDYFSSFAELEMLFNTEAQLLDILQVYVNQVSEHIEALKSEIESIRSEHLLATQNLGNYLKNPLNSYRLIKRLKNDWTTYEESIHNDVSTKNFLDAMSLYRETLYFPKEIDAHNAVMALVRLQDAYQIDAAQMASGGALNGIEIGSAMSWQDCFLLGHQLYEMQDFNHTVPWLKQSMKMLAAEEYNEHPLSLDFMETVAAYHEEMGELASALELVKHILAVDPTRESVKQTEKYLEAMILKEQQPQIEYHETNEYKLYEKVCRTEISITPEQQRSLRCKYHTNSVAYRFLQPFKMEELYHEPYIVQYHDMIRKEQMKVLKQLAAPKMARSLVYSTFNSTNEVAANYRTSKSAWFDYKTHQFMIQMRQIVADFSGLDMANVEELQIANYGLGGLYEPHWDFFMDIGADKMPEGNRLATAIFYLSDVQEGGGTAFPFLPLLVQPLPGSVLFWYNLHASEEPDYRTKHGACPVLRGSKWIANIWIHSRGQEFTHRCGLEPDYVISLKYKDFD